MARSKSKELPVEVFSEKRGIWHRFRDRFSLLRLEDSSNKLRSVFLNAIFLIAFIVILPVVISQFRRDEVIIEPIGVPEVLSKQGLTAEVAASRIWDGLQDTVKKAESSKASIVAIPDSRRVQFSFPDSGFSIDSLVYHLRRLFNAYETRIAGEFVCANEHCDRSAISLRLRVIRDGVEVVDMPPIGGRTERDYFGDAGARVLSYLDPFIALAALKQTQPVKAVTLARRLIRAHHKDAKWAQNMVGLIRLNGGDYQAAAEEFRAAIALDPAFPQARANLGGALLALGDQAGSQVQFEGLLKENPTDIWALQGMAQLMLAKNDPDKAIAYLMQAADDDPVNPLYFAKAGKIELDRGHKADGEKLLSRSLELDPGFLPAFAFLAATHLADGDYVAAERIYRDAADYAPDDPDAQASDGRILAILHKWPEAVARYERSTVLAPENVSYWLEYGRCLVEAGRSEDAARAFAKVVGIDPSNADVYLELAGLDREAARKDQAIANYKKFLELDKSSSPMRAVAERFIQILQG